MFGIDLGSFVLGFFAASTLPSWLPYAKQLFDWIKKKLSEK